MAGIYSKEYCFDLSNKDICLHFKIEGEVDPDKAERAVKLSVEKYCSVSKTLEPTAKITYKISIN